MEFSAQGLVEQERGKKMKNTLSRAHLRTIHWVSYSAPCSMLCRDLAVAHPSCSSPKERNRHGTRIVAEDIATSWRNCSFLLHPPPSADTRCPHHHPFVSSMQMTSRFGRDARGSSSSGGRINSRAWDSLAPRFLSMAAPQRFGKKK
ncbi:pro-FMRFamide-related neuropeptide FF isoform X3 [Hemicordylus capensis]|uniref:pro-FMRFamide-related neuropeptide FF isoform X3 n=1 Tax=Hemicordylus capensis TaxID=884348 RepID=UPI002303A0E8|nr:pro-FMRFamide-related neuropeptide FF isoform X3 [Hemicordylus capensis]